MQPNYRVILTDQARAHLAEIVAFLQLDPPDQAKATSDWILDAAKSLSKMPLRFEQVAGSRKRNTAVHVFVIAPYIIYYKVRESVKTVDVVGIRHGRQRRTRRFP